MTPEQRRRHEDEQRRLRRLRQQNQGGSLSSVIDQHDDMVEAYTPQNSCPRPTDSGIQDTSYDSGSDSGGSCD
ncbi:hypothetical protein pEaSNUABM9_00093 [Erwinia phage pEa_SNUABM_9]|nr:hypothetical protein pEaSNUABM9_00093 [Erwinia phage pEa_SNUABM_9]